jgi:hypothetical protein
MTNPDKKTGYIDYPIISWDNECDAMEKSTKLLGDLSKNPDILTDLLHHAYDNPALRAMCECHSYDDKIVLFNGLDTHGYRIRFRLAKNNQQERIHNHRFSAVHYILQGKFQQKFYRPKKDITECKTVEDFEFISETSHQQNEAFLVSYQDFHASFTSQNTISLLLRGGVKNKQAFGINCDDNTIRIRNGYADSTPQENEKHQMSDTVFKQWVSVLYKNNIINRDIING